MRRDVLQLRRFYASPLGRAAREMIGRKLDETWGDARDLDVLGLGYSTPFLHLPKARRAVTAMPAAQGVEAWPVGAAGRVCLAEETALPFPNAVFDRILVVHGLEESDDPAAMMREVRRVLAPSGRAVIVAASRLGLWSDAEDTPFGYGTPYSRAQLESLVREAELEPLAWARALYVPPLELAAGWAGGFEQAGSRLWPAFSGLILLEAVKQTFAVKPKAAAVRARRAGAFKPAAAGPMLSPPARFDDKGRGLRYGSPRAQELKRP
jgi:SAM-dependent methyltransferase